MLFHRGKLKGQVNSVEQPPAAAEDVVEKLQGFSTLDDLLGAIMRRGNKFGGGRPGGGGTRRGHRARRREVEDRIGTGSRDSGRGKHGRWRGSR